MTDRANEAGERAFSRAIEVTAELRRDPARLRTRLPVVHRSLDEFCEEALRGAPIACKPGCSACCHQWIPGVKAFEIERIAAHVEESLDKDAVIRSLRERSDAYRTLDDPDRDLAYARLGLPCVFLSVEGTCDIRSIRPMTCRTFFSFGPPDRCAGDPRASCFALDPHPSYEDVLGRAEPAFTGDRSYSGDLVTDLLLRLGG